MSEYVNSKELVPGRIYFSGDGAKSTWCYLGRNYDNEYIWVTLKNPMLFANDPTFTTVAEQVQRYGREALRITKQSMRVVALRFRDRHYYSAEIAATLGGYCVQLPTNIYAILNNWTFWYYTNLNLDAFRANTLTECQLVPGALYLLEPYYKESFVYLGKSTNGWLVWFRLSTRERCTALVKTPTGDYVRATINKAVLAGTPKDVVIRTPVNYRMLALTETTATVRRLERLVKTVIDVNAFTQGYLESLCDSIDSNAIAARKAQLTKRQALRIATIINTVKNKERYRNTYRQTAKTVQFSTDYIAYEIPIDIIKQVDTTLPPTTNNDIVQSAFNKCCGVYEKICIDVPTFLTELHTVYKQLKCTGVRIEKAPYIINFHGRNHGFRIDLLIQVFELLGKKAEMFFDDDPLDVAYVRSDIGRLLLYPVRIFGDAIADRSIANKVI